MYFWEILRTAVTQLRANRLRSVLTTLGIVIGIGTVILIVSVLEGFRISIASKLNNLGANTFQVERYGERFVRMGHGKFQRRKILKPELADAIRARCPSVKFVGVEVWASGQVIVHKDKRTNSNVFVAGATPEFTINNGMYVSDGRFLNDSDVRSSAHVAIIGLDIADKIFPYENPLGKVIRIKGQKFKVIGIFEKQGSSAFGSSRDNRLVIPLGAWEETFGRKRSVTITVMARSRELFQQAQDEVIGVLRAERKVPPGKDNDFAITSNESLAESFNKIARMIQLGGIAIGIISLLVGGIGVMNVMLVSVTERTREIGVRKAVGAPRSAIMRQFLMEAITLCLLGGVLGFAGGVGLAALLSALANIPMAVPVWAVLAAVIGTTVVGVLAGIYPAHRAANLNVIDALRYE